MKKFKTAVLLTVMGMLISGIHAGDFAVRRLKLDHPDGIYKTGETITVTGTLLKAKKPAPGYKLRVTTRWDSVKDVDTREFPCDGKPFEVTFKSDKPGWVYFTFQVIDENGKVVNLPAAKKVQGAKPLLVDEIGAMISPEEIRTADECPADLEEFWKNERAKLDAVPMNPRLEKIDSGRPGIDLYTVTLDAGVSRPVTGYLAVPVGAKEKSLPIYLTFLDGVAGDAYRNKALAVASYGCVAMITTWHGFDVNRDKAYYQENCKRIDRNRWESAERGRDAFYFREVFVRAMRAADYLKTRPEWNGKDFLVAGGSLAGAQAAATAALDPQVTIAFIHTPSNNGYNADLAGRKRGYPYHWQPDAWIKPEMRKGNPYCDIAHLAKFIKCECYFCTGFADEVCTPSNVYSAYNNVPAGVKKTMTTNPRTGHYSTTKDYRADWRFEEFFRDYWKSRGGFQLQR